MDEDKLTFDYDLLHDTVKVITKNLNKIIDKTFILLLRLGDLILKHRPIGIGTQGLADVFAILRIPFESEEAQVLNRNIFETIYHAAVETSMEISKKRNSIIHKLKPKEKIL